MTQMIELVKMNIKIIIKLYAPFKKLEERLMVLISDVEEELAERKPQWLR